MAFQADELKLLEDWVRITLQIEDKFYHRVPGHLTRVVVIADGRANLVELEKAFVENRSRILIRRTQVEAVHVGPTAS